MHVVTSVQRLTQGLDETGLDHGASVYRPHVSSSPPSPTSSRSFKALVVVATPERIL
jgi:hypothetical protein